MTIASSVLSNTDRNGLSSALACVARMDLTARGTVCGRSESSGRRSVSQRALRRPHENDPAVSV